MCNKKYMIVLIPIILVLIISGVVMLLWNYLMPELFGLKIISYPQAFALFVLCKILFGGMFGKKPGFKNKINSNTNHIDLKNEWIKRCSNKNQP